MKTSTQNPLRYRKGATTADIAAEAFYGQSDQGFQDQIKAICANDPRLINVFERTRATYLGKDASKTTPR